MKVLIVNGSPRKNGSSSFIADKIKEKYSENGNGGDLLFLNELNFKGCQGCLSCRKHNSFCVVADELHDILPKIVGYDAIVLVSPNYYGFVTGQMKLFLDRWYCLKDRNRRSKFKENAKLFFIVTQGSPNRDHAQNIINWGRKIFESFNLKFFSYTIPGCDGENTDMAQMKFSELNTHLNMFLG